MYRKDLCVLSFENEQVNENEVKVLVEDTLDIPSVEVQKYSDSICRALKNLEESQDDLVFFDFGTLNSQGLLMSKHDDGKGSYTYLVSPGQFKDDMSIAKPTILSALGREETELIKLEGKVLVADDSPDILEYICFLLEQMQVDYTAVKNGKEALQKVLEENFDIVFLDLQMPLMDGYQTARALRESGFNKQIIALTASLHDVQSDCLKAGFNSYLNKPLDFNRFFKAIEASLTKQRSVSLMRPKYFSDEKWEKLLNDFVNYMEEDLSSMQQACIEGDYARIRLLAHKVRGAAYMYGYKTLSGVLSKIELAAEAQEGEVLSLLLEQAVNLYEHSHFAASQAA